MTKTYTTRANARRALSKIGDKALAAAKTLIEETGAGEFLFSVEAAEAIQYEEVATVEADNEIPDWMDSALTFEQVMVEHPVEAPVAETVEPVQPAPANKTGEVREAMKTSLKLDRRIVCVETDEEFKNAFQMWKAPPDWMTSSEVDRLTGQLYAAAKRGEQILVTIGERSFHLLNVNG